MLVSTITVPSQLEVSRNADNDQLNISSTDSDSIGSELQNSIRSEAESAESANIHNLPVTNEAGINDNVSVTDSSVHTNTHTLCDTQWISKSAMSTELIKNFTNFIQVNGKNYSANCKLCYDGKPIKFTWGINSNLLTHLKNVSVFQIFLRCLYLCLQKY